MEALLLNSALSVVCFFVTLKVIPSFMDLFVKANLYGRDMSKTSQAKVPEALGVISGAMFLNTMFLFIPIPFVNQSDDVTEIDFHHRQVLDLFVV